MVSHFTQNKAKVILGAHRALYDLPFSLIRSCLLLFFSCSSLTSLLAEPFLNPFTGWLFYWDPHILMTITPTSFESRFSCHLLNKVHPDHCPHENLNVKPHLTCFLFFSAGGSCWVVSKGPSVASATKHSQRVQTFSYVNSTWIFLLEAS